MNVWALAVRYANGDDITITTHSSRETALAEFYHAIVLEYWDNEIMGCEVPEGASINEAIDLFMEAFGDDFEYSIQKCRLPSGIVPEESIDEEAEILMTPGELEIVSKSLLHVNLEKVSKEFRDTSPKELEDRIIEIAKKMG